MTKRKKAVSGGLFGAYLNSTLAACSSVRATSSQPKAVKEVQVFIVGCWSKKKTNLEVVCLTLLNIGQVGKQVLALS